MITPQNVQQRLLNDDVIQQSYIYSYASKKYWKILKDIDITLSDGSTISIPSGFYYDMSSAPRLLWGIFSPFNDGLLGYLIHDYLYATRHTGRMTRKQADKEMLFWTNLTNSNKFDNYLRYVAVRLFGWTYWKV
jgi:hypothetical protein